MRTLATTENAFQDLRNMFESGESRVPLIEPGVAYRMTDVPETSDGESASWAFSPDGYGAYWYGSLDQLVEDVG